MLKTLLDCLFALGAFRRLRHRKKHRCVISETGNELLHIEVFERAQNFRVNASMAARSTDSLGSMAGVNGDAAVRNAIAKTLVLLLIAGTRNDT
jgi:hypothetical protein